MVALDLLARFAYLLDHEEAGLSLGDTLDPCSLMARHDNEAGRVMGNPVEVAWRDLGLLDTDSIQTLAVKRVGGSWSRRSSVPAMLRVSQIPLRRPPGLSRT